MARAARSIRAIWLAALLAAGMLATQSGFVLPVAAVGPLLVAAPNPAAPTAAVKLTGSGFSAGQPVGITVDQTPTASTTSDGTGAFVVTINVPATAMPGNHQVVAADAAGRIAKTNLMVQSRWTVLGFDSARTGLNPYENVLTPERVSGLSLSGFSPPVAVTSSPILSGNRVYFGAQDGLLRAANSSTGDILWSVATGGPILSTPAIVLSSCPSIIFGSDDGMVRSVTCAGAPIWSFPTTSPVRSSPLIRMGAATPLGVLNLVYIGSGDHNLYALNLATGGVVWSAAFGGAVDGSPSLVEGVGSPLVNEVVVGSADGTVRAFKAGDGTPLWSTPVGGPVTGPVALTKASGPIPCQAFVAVGPVSPATTGSVRALRCSTGATTGAGTWSHALTTIPAASPALMPTSGGGLSAGFNVLIGGSDGNVYALDRALGTEKWSKALGGGAILAGAAIAGGLAYVSSAAPGIGADGSLKILDGAGNVDGSIPFSGGSPTSAPAAIVANGFVFAPTGSGLSVFSLLSIWPQFHYDVANSGYNPYDYKQNPGWTFHSGSLMFSPVMANGLVYVGSSNGNVYALRASTGVFQWIYTTGDWVVAAPAVVGTSLYVGSKDGNVYALNALTGALLWSVATSGPVSAPATVKSGVVYVGSEDGTLYALAASDGSLLWSFGTGGKIFGAPAVVNGVVYFGSLDHNVYALNASDGSVVWTHATGGGVASSPAVVNGVVYVGSYDSNMYALSAANGGVVWTFATGGWIFSSPAVAYGEVFFGSTDGIFYALDLNANKVWTAKTGAMITSSPAVANGIVAWGSYDGKLYFGYVKAGIGCTYVPWVGPSCWGGSVPAGGEVYASPAIGDGRIYVGSFGNEVLAIGT